MHRTYVHVSPKIYTSDKRNIVDNLLHLFSTDAGFQETLQVIDKYIPKVINYIKDPGMLVIIWTKFKAASSRISTRSKQLLEGPQNYTEQTMLQNKHTTLQKE